jgi:dihydrofolate reductase
MIILVLEYNIMVAGRARLPADKMPAPLQINIIAAVETGSRAIGQTGRLPWYLPEDLKRFKRLTMGHPIVMGRKTFESIGKVLPGRTNIIITRRADYQPIGVVVAASLDEALRAAAGSPGGGEVFVIGGGEIFQQVMPLARRLYLTEVQSQNGGDVFFPDYSSFTKELAREDHSENNPPFSFVTLEK